MNIINGGLQVIASYTISVEGVAEVLMPFAAQVLSVRADEGHVAVSVLEDASKRTPKITRRFKVARDGEAPPASARQFWGTAVVGGLAVHLFEME